jgi:hypothetical protein
MRPLSLLLLLSACDTTTQEEVTPPAPTHAAPSASSAHGITGKPVLQKVCETIIAVAAEVPTDQQDSEGFRYRQERQGLGRNMGAQMVLRNIRMRSKEMQPAYIAALAEVTDSGDVCAPLIQGVTPTPKAKTDVGMVCHALEYALAALPENTKKGDVQKWLDIWTKESLATNPPALAHYTKMSAAEPYARQHYMAEQIKKENAVDECTAWSSAPTPTRPESPEK